MIIISQDRAEIINFDNTLNIALYEDDDDKGWQIYAGMKAPDDNYRILGYYQTEERAKEVLKDISVRYTLSKMSQSINFNCKNDASDYMPTYEMPEE